MMSFRFTLVVVSGSTIIPAFGVLLKAAMVLSMSPASRTPPAVNCTARDGAATSMPFKYPGHPKFALNLFEPCDLNRRLRREIELYGARENLPSEHRFRFPGLPDSSHRHHRFR